MASCEYLRDGSAHGIADDYRLVQAERLYQLGQVVGARFNTEWRSPPAEATVAAQVRRDGVERPAQVIE